MVAVSSFNAAKEKHERDALRAAPEGPGVASLIHMLNKRSVLRIVEWCFLK